MSKIMKRLDLSSTVRGGGGINSSQASAIAAPREELWYPPPPAPHGACTVMNCTGEKRLRLRI